MKKRILVLSFIIVAVSIVVAKTYNSKETVMLTQVVAVEKTEENKKIKNKVFTDFIYEIGPRFTPITKSDLRALSTFNDYIGEEHASRIISFHSLQVMLMIGNEPSDQRIIGTSNEFTNEQLNFLYRLDYSTNLMMWADYKEKNAETGQIEDAHWTPYLTIVPEKQATYPHGIQALKDFLKENSQETRDIAKVEPNKLQPAKLFFTVTKHGAIENIRLDRTSNYPTVDKKMMELIQMTPGQWQPAENELGEKVDQELVVSFGLIGC
jgi:hypothetical protein